MNSTPQSLSSSSTTLPHPSSSSSISSFHPQFFSKGEFSFSLDESGNCYIWGNNEDNKLSSLPFIIDTPTPFLLLPSNEKVRFIACGLSHTIFVSGRNNC